MNKKKNAEEPISREQHLRLAADFDNFKKECATRVTQAMSAGKQSIVEDVLDALDTLAIAKSHEEWTEGLESAVNAFLEALSRHGVERIETERQSFDPVTMEAVGTVPGGDVNTVQSEQRAGWRMHDRVIRPARVIVFQ